jgi:hypothetical protein
MHGSLAVESTFLPDPNASSFPHEISVQATMAEAGEDVIQEEVEGPNAWGREG